METFEIKYFLAAAEYQSIHRAAQSLSISSPAVSRAISRIEEELGVQLFERVGRNIVLSENGKFLQREASQIIGRLDDLKSKFKPSEHAVAISIKGTEFGVSAFTPYLLERLQSAKVKFRLEVKIAPSSREVESAVNDGECHIGIVSKKPSEKFAHVKLGRFSSHAYVGPGHRLYSEAKKSKSVTIEEVLKHEFVSFLEPVFSEAENILLGTDGWRDDRFKRKIVLKTESVESAVRTVESGCYLGYFPEPLAKGRNILRLKITGCPYRCETEGFLIALEPSRYGWMRALF